MEQFELIFKINTNKQNLYIAPQYLSANCKDQDALSFALKGRNLRDSFILRFTGYIPNNIFLRLIAFFGSRSYPGPLYWKKGIVFYSNDAKIAYVEYKRNGEHHNIHVRIEDDNINLAYEIIKIIYDQSDPQNLMISVDGTSFIPIAVLLSEKKYPYLIYNNIVYDYKDFPFICGIENQLINAEVEQKHQAYNSENTIGEIKQSVISDFKIFLASSSELKPERDKLEDFLNQQNKFYIKKNVFLKTIRWEYFIDAITTDGKQAKLNEQAREADIVICLLFKKVGANTKAEFEAALNEFMRTGKPRIYVYFKDERVLLREVDPQEFKNLTDFKIYLSEIKEYPNYFKNVDNLINQVNHQLNLLFSNMSK